MKLGIVVVYLVSEENEKLLDLHLHQIERHTKVPYTIYASTKRLLPRFREKLERHPKVKICQSPKTDLRGAEEHSFYLEHLVRDAVMDGCSHIVTLHVDSFPIRLGWAEELAERLSDSCVLATLLYGPYSCCLLFHRDFYLKYHPTFLLSETDRSSWKHKQFLQDHLLHSGIGYCLKAYSEGLTWYRLRESNRGNARYGFFSQIYDDLIFHLGAAAYAESDESLKSAQVLSKTGLIPPLQTIQSAIRLFIPEFVREWTWGHVGIPMSHMVLKSVYRFGRSQRRMPEGISSWIPKSAMRWIWNHFGVPMFSKPIFWEARRKLLEDPESYLNSLRTNKK